MNKKDAKFNIKTKITFFRHGTTEHNTNNIYSGVLNPPLDEKGIKIVKEGAKNIENEKYDVLLYGYMKRVEQTAHIVMETLKNKPEKILQTKEIYEMNFGDFEGLTYDQIQRKYPDEWKRYRADMKSYSFPNGDCVEEFYNYCVEISNKILLEYNNKNILIVGHKGFILACVAAMQNEGINGMYSRDLRHANTLRLEVFSF